MQRINIVVIESDDDSFERTRDDVQKFSRYVGKIYRCSYHRDLFILHGWRQCRLIIANNPENEGIKFLKSFYMKEENTEKIFSVLYTRGFGLDERIVRDVVRLYTKSNRFFLGIVFKRYGSIELLLEIIRNIAHEQQFYPILDVLPKEEQFLLDPFKLECYRKIHNLKHEILSQLRLIYHPVLNLLKEERRLVAPDSAVESNIFSPTSLLQSIRNLEKIKLNGKKLIDRRSEFEMVYYMQQLMDFGELFSNELAIADQSENQANVRSSAMSESEAANAKSVFLRREGENFVQSLNSLVRQMDEKILK